MVAVGFTAAGGGVYEGVFEATGFLLQPTTKRAKTEMAARSERSSTGRYD